MIKHRDWIGEYFGTWKLLDVESRQSRSVLHLQCPCGAITEQDTMSLWLRPTKCSGCGTSFDAPDREFYENTPTWKEISKLLHYKNASEAKASYMIAIAKLKMLLPDYEDLVNEHDYKSSY